MIRLLLILILTFSFQSWTKADDIRDFVIGKFTLDKSLLNYLNKKELINNWMSQKHTYGFTSKKYYKFGFWDADAEPYDSIVIYSRKNDELFKIQSITGIIKDMNINNCYIEMISVSNEISKLFPSTAKTSNGPFKKKVDPSGDSTEKNINFRFIDGSAAGLSCLDYGAKFSKKNSWATDHMQIYLDTKNYSNWLTNEAWK